MMYKRLKHFKYHITKFPLKILYLLTITSFIFLSCSIDKQGMRKQNKLDRKNKKIEKRVNKSEKQKLRKIDNNFLAYYNTYYLSKIKFKNALELQSKSNNSDSRNTSVNNSYYEEAIKYADIIIENFYNTEYIDDAYYIKARSSYLKNILSPSSYYFKKIIEDEESPFYYDALVHLGFISLKLDDLDQFHDIIFELDMNINNFNKNIFSLDNKRPYKFLQNELLSVTSRYYLLKAESSIYFDKDIIEIEKYFLLSIETSNNENKIIDIYNQILSLYTNHKDYNKMFKYLSILLLESSSDIENEQLEEDWFSSARLSGNYNLVLEYINERLQKDLSVKERLFYVIEKSKSYYDLGMILESVNLFNEVLIDYEQYVATYKNYFSDIYYNLGKIYLENYLNFEESLNYFNLASEKDNLNLKAKSFSNSINNYLELLDNYNDNPSLIDSLTSDTTNLNIENAYYGNGSLNNNENIYYIPLPEDYNFNLNNNSDTLLFNMASLLHFNLGLDSLAIKNLELIYYESIESPLIPKVIFMLEKIKPNINWKEDFAGKNKLFSLSEESHNDVAIEKERTLAFNSMDISFYKAIEQFEKIFNEYNDWFSLYMIGFLYDSYIGDLSKAVEYYKKYIENEDSEKYIQVKSRLNSIENLILDENNFIKQKITYLNAAQYIDGGLFDIDTLSNELEECKKGPNRLLNEKCGYLLDVVGFPNPKKISDSLLINIIDKWSNGMKMDKRLLTIGNIISEETNNLVLAKDYYKLVIDYYKNSEHIYDVFLKLQNLDDEIQWADSLAVYVKDKYDLVDEYKARTGSDVISAINNRLYPLDFTSTHQIYEIYLDSINSEINIDDYLPSEIYDVSFKENVMVGRKNSKENYLLSHVTDIKDYSEYFSITDDLILQWEDDFEVARELSSESYLLSPNIKFIKSSLSSIQMNDRYNINNTESDCSYLNNDYKCYEIEVIPSENDYYKNLWVLKIDKNQYLLIKEQSFDLNGNIISEIDLEYEILEPYYMLNKVVKTDFKNKLKRIQLINEISVNNGLSDFIFNIHKGASSFDKPLNIDALYIEHTRLDSIYNLLFFVPVPIDTESNINALNESIALFSYNQSINQYFYFVEDASVGGVELTGEDWLISYNNDVIVGARKYIKGGMIDIPIMGYDNSSENTKIATDGYCKIGDIPIIKVFKPNGEFIELDVIQIDEIGLEFKVLGHSTVILKRD